MFSFKFLYVLTFEVWIVISIVNRTHMDKKGSQVTMENQGPITILSYHWYDVVCFSSRILLSIAHVSTVSPLRMIVLLDEMVKKHLIFPVAAQFVSGPTRQWTNSSALNSSVSQMVSIQREDN